MQRRAKENFENSSSRPYFNYVSTQEQRIDERNPFEHVEHVKRKDESNETKMLELEEFIQVFLSVDGSIRDPIRLPLACTVSPNCDFKCLRRNVSFACSFPIKIDEEQFSNKWQRK